MIIKVIYKLENEEFILKSLKNSFPDAIIVKCQNEIENILKSDFEKMYFILDSIKIDNNLIDKFWFYKTKPTIEEKRLLNFIKKNNINNLILSEFMNKNLSSIKLVLKGKKELLERIKVLKIKSPKLVIIQLLNDAGSEIYLRNKIRWANELGIKIKIIKIIDNVNFLEISELISSLNFDSTVNGILIQHPVPHNIDFLKICDLITPSKDIDCLTSLNIGRSINHDNVILPCTPTGILELIDSFQFDLKFKNVLIINRTSIVGKLLVNELLKRDFTVTVAHSKTVNLKRLCHQSNLIISATGVGKIIKKDYIKNNTVCIDVGISRINKKISGDFDYLNIIKKNIFITPMPGVIGPLTLLNLFRNLIWLIENY